MFRSGLIGRNIGASRSPWLHEEEAKVQGFSLSYELFDFTARQLPDEALQGFLKEVNEAGYLGVNVTYPFKQAIIPFLTELSESAELVGAVNTVAFRDGQSIGHNTDYSGFRDSLLDGLNGRALGRVLQLGAGGAGSAVASALLSAGAEALSIFDIDRVRSSGLATRLSERFPGTEIAVLEDVPTSLADVDGVVNSTPIGMQAYPGIPVPAPLLAEHHWVADIVYFPLETELLRAARASGCLTIDGAGMVINQAATAFEIITQRTANAARMRQSFFAD